MKNPEIIAPDAPLLLAVCGASAQVLALRALQLLLEGGHCVDLVLSRGAFEVWRAEMGVVLPVAPKEQEQVLRQHCGTSKGSCAVTAGMIRQLLWQVAVIAAAAC